MVQCDTVWYSVVQCDTVWHSVVQCGTVRYSVIQWTPLKIIISGMFDSGVI